MGNAVQRDVVVAPTESFDEFTIGGVLVQIRTVAAVGAQDTQTRLRTGFERQARLELHVLSTEHPLPPPSRRRCGER